MILFLLGLAVGMALVIAGVCVLFALDKRAFPDCRKCGTPLTPGRKDKLCIACVKHAELQEDLRKV